MNLIFLRDSSLDGGRASLLRFALTDELLAGVVPGSMNGCAGQTQKCRRPSLAQGAGETIYAVPECWNIRSLPGRQRRRNDSNAESNVICYKDNLPIDPLILHKIRTALPADAWYAISDGRFVTQIDSELIDRVLSRAGADLVAITAKPSLLGASERLRLTPEGNVAGFRRLYSDSAEFSFVPRDWPHHLFIRAGVLDQLLTNGSLPLSFSDLSRKCQSARLKLRAVEVGGAVIDLETSDGMIRVCGATLSGVKARASAGYSPLISRDAKLIGKVLIGENVEIGRDAVIIGPSIVCGGARIERGAVVSSSIIGARVRVPENQIVRNRVIAEREYDWDRHERRQREGSSRPGIPGPGRRSNGVFRHWPRLSYARCIKRIADFVTASIVLILFAPVMPFIALAIKLNSQGPVFYADKRQGLHGREFGCLKFRTMITGAAKMQDKLRFVSQVDGPQFKMEDDPRISSVGRFLRATYIDEIPQFFNVLFGQMSIVGPRPSPESENTLCPSWRDARLSVRPGITGLWQLHRTREPMRDFQEWIHYDTMYVRNLSLKMDLMTCWQTAMKLFDNFISQF